MTRILGGGNVIPLDRSGSIDQPLFKRFHEKLVSGSWCHIFAEGKVRQSWRFEDHEPHLGDFKVGGKTAIKLGTVGKKYAFH